MSLTGTWSISISSPIGAQSDVLELTENNGVMVGVLKNEAEMLPLSNPVLQGTRLTWQSTMTKPFRLNLTFDVDFDGDILIGTSKVGIFPTSKVTGRRVVEN